MLSPDELATLESILERARASLGQTDSASIAPGDVIQLRPGADRAWECSLMLVTQVQGNRIRGQILRPRRGGSSLALSTYTAAEVTRVGRAPYPEPAADIRSMSYDPPCEGCLRKPPGFRKGALFEGQTTPRRIVCPAVFRSGSRSPRTARRDG